jgi:hypothetical protein
MTTSENDESLQVADFCLMHRSIMVSCTKPPPNGKNRPFLVNRDVVVPRPLRATAVIQFQPPDW